MKCRSEMDSKHLAVYYDLDFWELEECRGSLAESRITIGQRVAGGIVEKIRLPITDDRVANLYVIRKS